MATEYVERYKKAKDIIGVMGNLNPASERCNNLLDKIFKIAKMTIH